MLKRFREHIKERFPELVEGRFLIAFSGGMDSTVLVWLCHNLDLDFALAHCNFGLRGTESDEDAVWVQEFAQKIDKEIYVKNFKTDKYAVLNKVSVQVAARDLRYAWFKDIQKEMDLKYCITAHHADDNLETFLINLSRGTGIKGLMGIPEKTSSVARPLLIFGREEIADYALEQRLQWREDSSNREFKYLRNQIRHKVLPRLKETHPTFMENFAESQQHIRESEAMLQNHLKEIREQAFEEDKGVIRISLSILNALSPKRAYLYGLLSDYGFREWSDVESLLESKSGKQLYSKYYRLIKDREFLLLQPIQDSEYKVYEYDFPIDSISEPVALKIEEVQEIGELSESIIYLDKETLKGSLTVRKWKKGDYFYPFGMRGKKKLLSKYFKDEKMDLIAKENQWLLCTEEAIVWVIGRRADDRFRVTEKTKKIIKITYSG